MLARPFTENRKLAKLWKLRRKFNDVLTDLLEIEQYMHVMTIPNMDEARYFDNCGALMEIGKKQFWVSLNEQFKSFEYHALDDSTTQQSSHSDGEYVRNTKKLPTPPPKSRIIIPAKSRIWTTKKISSRNESCLRKSRSESRRRDRYSEERDRDRDNYHRRQFDNY